MNKYYRYCFFCDKWLTEEQVNKVEYGENQKGYYCSTCRKDTGNTPQIFKCPNHNEIILKVWGNLEGQNKEKVFYKECPKENQQEEINTGKTALIFVGSVILLVGTIWLVWRYFKGGQDE